MLKRQIIILMSLLCLSSCANIDTTADYSSGNARNAELAVPPGLTSPDLETNYKIIGEDESTYHIDKIKNFAIQEGGSQRWLVISNKKVDQIWPTMMAYLSQQGLSVKYQNKGVGLIQTDWATKNNVVNETGVRKFFGLAGWGSMYSLDSQYMFRVTLWQDGDDTHIFVTSYLMNLVYVGCVPARNSTVEASDKERTTWMAVPPDPQVELDFLLKFVEFAGADTNKVKQANIETKEAAGAAPMASLNGNQLIIYDQFDRAWWRTGLALERVGLGIADKNRSNGEYYVYSLQSQIDNPKPGFLSKIFGGDAQAPEAPKAQYTVKLVTSNNQTILTISTYNGANSTNDMQKAMQKYLNDLLTQLK